MYAGLINGGVSPKSTTEEVETLDVLREGRSGIEESKTVELNSCFVSFLPGPPPPPPGQSSWPVTHLPTA